VDDATAPGLIQIEITGRCVERNQLSRAQAGKLELCM